MAVFNVTNLLDMGAGSLRDAIDMANMNPGDDIINFDISLSGMTIGLTSGELSITDSLTINGLGSGNLSISRDSGLPEFRIFNIDNNDIDDLIDVVINGLTISGGELTGDLFPDNSGGGIFNAENLTLNNSTVSGNMAFTGGGIQNFYGVLTLEDSNISDNIADFGGGINNVYGDVDVVNSTISGNNANEDGGGIQNDGGLLLVYDSNVTDNTASYNGGGIDNYFGLFPAFGEGMKYV